MESDQCVSNQLAQVTAERDTLRAKLDSLLSQRMDEAEAKLAKRPAEAVVQELQAENRRLREALEEVGKGDCCPLCTADWDKKDQREWCYENCAVGKALTHLRGVGCD